jgi:hypothetical protein
LHLQANGSKVQIAYTFSSHDNARYLKGIGWHACKYLEEKMKKYSHMPLFILLFLLITSCQSTPLSQLQATNQALSNQLNTLLTQQAPTASIATQAPLIKESDIIVTTEIPSVSPNDLTGGQSSVINSALIYAGSGSITPWTNKTAYSNTLFGAANVHMICDPDGTSNGKMYIDKETETASCGARGESWTPWKQDITIGDHYIYSSNANDKYEFWTVGTTPFTIHNKFSHSDFIFSLPDAGIYTLTANLIKGVYNVYLTCQQDQNFNYKITQSTSVPVVILSPATCMLIIRDVNQAKTSQAEIEVSMEISR